jgi:hypothetical protein
MAATLIQDQYARDVLMVVRDIIDQLAGLREREHDPPRRELIGTAIERTRELQDHKPTPADLCLISEVLLRMWVRRDSEWLRTKWRDQATDSATLVEIPPGIRRSQEAYWRALPELLRFASRKRQWVAFHGEERVGFSRTEAELYQTCYGRGLNDLDFYVGRLRPHETPPWVPEEIEPLFESAG